VFGANPIRKRTISDGQALAVQEIFNTLQGEGPDSGRPATFVRLWGCHLQCWFCDTDFESNNQTLAIADIVARVRTNTKARLVVITGGEPLRQNLVPLVKLLIHGGNEVQIETAGSFWWQDGTRNCDLYEDPIRQRWSFVVSPKTPRIDVCTAEDARAFKYVIGASTGLSPHDGLPVCNYQQRDGTSRALARPPAHWFTCRREDIFLQPMDEGDDMRNAYNRALCARLAQEHGYRISLQAHKLLAIP